MCRGWKPYSDAKVLIMYAKTLHTLENNVIFFRKIVGMQCYCIPE